MLRLPDPPRALANDLVANALKECGADLRKLALDGIDVTDEPEQIIRKRLGLLLTERDQSQSSELERDSRAN